MSPFVLIYLMLCHYPHPLQTKVVPQSFTIFVEKPLKIMCKTTSGTNTQTKFIAFRRTYFAWHVRVVMIIFIVDVRGWNLYSVTFWFCWLIRRWCRTEKVGHKGIRLFFLNSVSIVSGRAQRGTMSCRSVCLNRTSLVQLVLSFCNSESTSVENNLQIINA